MPTSCLRLLGLRVTLGSHAVCLELCGNLVRPHLAVEGSQAQVDCWGVGLILSSSTLRFITFVLRLLSSEASPEASISWQVFTCSSASSRGGFEAVHILWKPQTFTAFSE